MKAICFDLEGPLSPQDNAYELMKLFHQGGQVFEVLSRYDDLLALEGKEGYEPGDTLALIAPFLIHHNVTEDCIVGLAQRATLVAGARELVVSLTSQDWKVFCISTSYHQYACHVARRAGIPPENLASTLFTLDRYRGTLSGKDLAPVASLEGDIAALRPLEDDEKIKKRLDHFYRSEIAGTGLGTVLQEVKPVGGQRKVEALERFALANSIPLEDCAVVGDSITDARMLQTVNRAGGLAVAFNANEYALPYATIGLASTNLDDLKPVLMAWEEGGRKVVETLVREKERAGGVGDRGHFQWLVGWEELEKPLVIHKHIRQLVRKEAGKLG